MIGLIIMAAYELLVGGTAVNITGAAGAGPSVALDSFSVSYTAPRELQFHELGNDGVYSFAPNAPAIFRVDGAEVFNGKIVKRAGGRSYVAKDARAGVKINLFNPETNRTEIKLPRMPANEVIEILFEMHAEQMGREGVPSALQNAPTGEVAEHSYAGTLLEAVLHILGQLPGWEVLINPEAWKFIDTRISPEFTVALDSLRTGGLDGLADSLEDRFTAVRVLGASVSILQKDQVTASPAWDESLEPGWQYGDHKASASAAGDPTSKASVFRRWSVPPSVASRILHNVRVTQTNEDGDQISSGQPVLVVGDYNVLGQPRFHPHRISSLENISQGIVISEEPLLALPSGDRVNYRNPHQPGKSRRAQSVALRFWSRINLPSPGVRRPQEGFEGSAYTIAGIEREKVHEVGDVGLITGEYAQQILDQLKDMVVQGSIDIYGEVPAGLWHLDRRINVTSGNRTTGYESLAVPLRSLSYRFMEQSATLDLSTPLGGLP